MAQIPTDERRFKPPKVQPTVSYVRPTGPAPQGKFGSPSAMGFSPAYTPTVQPRPENKGFAAAATTPPKSFFPTKEFWADPTGYGQPLYDNFLSKILPSKERLDNSSFSYLNLLDPKNSFTPSMIPGIIGSAVPGGKAFNFLGEAIKSSGYADTISQYGPLAALGVTAAKMFGNRNDPIAMARNLMPLFQSVVTGNVVGGLNDMTGLDWGPAVPAIYPKANLGFVNPQYPSSANAGSYSQWLTDPRVTQNSPKLLPAPRKEDYLPGESTSYLHWNEKQWLDYQRKEGLTNFDTSFLPTVKPKGAGGGFKGFTHGDWGSIKQIMDQFFTNQDPPPSVGDKNADPDFIKAFEEELFDNPGVNPYILWNNMMKNFVPLQDRPKMGYTDSDGREWISKEAKDNFFEMVKNWKEPEPDPNPPPSPPELWWPRDLPNLTNPTDFMGKNEEGDFPDMPEETYAEKMQRWLEGPIFDNERDEYAKFMLGKDYDPEADDTPDWEPPSLPADYFLKPKENLTNWFPPGWQGPDKGFQFLESDNDYYFDNFRENVEDDYFDYFTSMSIPYGPNQDQSKDWGPSFDEQIRNPSYDETDPENPYKNYEIQNMNDAYQKDAQDPISYTDSLGNEWANKREFDDFIESLGNTRNANKANWEEARSDAAYNLFMSQVEHWDPKWGPINNTPYQWMNNNPEPFDSQKMITHPKSSFGNIETGEPYDYNKYSGTPTMHEGGDVLTGSGFEKEGDKEHPIMAWGRLSVDDKLMVYNALNSGGNEPSSLRFLPEHIKSAIRTSFGERGNQSSIHSYAENRILPPLSQMNQPNWEEDFRRVHAITRGIFLNNEIKMGQDTPDWADPKFKPGRPIP